MGNLKLFERQVVDEELTYADLYKRLLIHEDIIVVIGGEDFYRLRKGISSIKAKDNAKLKEADLPTEKFKIEYDKLDEDRVNKSVKIRIRIVKPDSLVVKSFIVSDEKLI